MKDQPLCAFPPCPRQGVETLSLVVGGAESEVLACPRHADWIRSYVEEDPGVQILHAAREAQPPVA
jgi:hypothetical protein